MNSIILSGRLARDPQRKDGELVVVKFTVAVNRSKTKDGAEAADFISCVAFGKQAEFISKYFTKGKPISLGGRLQTGSYEKDGRKVYTTDVIVERVEFVPTDKTEKVDERPDVTTADTDEYDDLPF